MEIIKVFREEIPAMRFIGKRYREFGHWGEWWENGWFDLIEETMDGVENILNIWENGGGYLGLERHGADCGFEYIIGMFAPENTSVPDGFTAVDFIGADLGTCWIQGQEDEVHNTSECSEKLAEYGMEIFRDNDGAVWSFENCLCPRYTTPDANGNIILDYCHFIKR